MPTFTDVGQLFVPAMQPSTSALLPPTTELEPMAVALVIAPFELDP
jgi:hypothetical protein